MLFLTFALKKYLKRHQPPFEATEIWLGDTYISQSGIPQIICTFRTKIKEPTYQWSGVLIKWDVESAIRENIYFILFYFVWEEESIMSFRRSTT